MNSTQIKNELTTLGYQVNKWIIPTKITTIKLNCDANIHIDSECCMYRFNSNDELLEITYGKRLDNNTFLNKYGETSNYTPSTYIDYENIAGFIRSEVFTSSSVSLRGFTKMK